MQYRKSIREKQNTATTLYTKVYNVVAVFCHGILLSRIIISRIIEFSKCWRSKFEQADKCHCDRSATAPAKRLALDNASLMHPLASCVHDAEQSVLRVEILKTLCKLICEET